MTDLDTMKKWAAEKCGLALISSETNYYVTPGDAPIRTRLLCPTTEWFYGPEAMRDEVVTLGMPRISFASGNRARFRSA